MDRFKKSKTVETLETREILGQKLETRITRLVSKRETTGGEHEAGAPPRVSSRPLFRRASRKKPPLSLFPHPHGGVSLKRVRRLSLHPSGVTCIAWSSRSEHEFWSGSYDEVARVWDARRPAQPLARSAPLGGGCWRLRREPGAAAEGRDEFVSPCMRGGVHVLTADATNAGAVVSRFHHDKHGEDSIAYGADYHHRKTTCDHPTALVASCSFYDRRLHLWRAPRAKSAKVTDK